MTKKWTVFFLIFMILALVLPAGADGLTVTETNVVLNENSNVSKISAASAGLLPSIGEPEILVFYTTFSGGRENWTKSVEEVEEMFFSDAMKNEYDTSKTYGAQDSLRSYYYRSSYGKVDITGDIYEYTTQKDAGSYPNIKSVADEIVEYYREIIPWENYDSNGDGYLDGFYIITRTHPSFGLSNHVTTYSNEVDGIKISQYCVLNSYTFQVMCHETCHMFGPADMYGGVLLNPNGIQTACIMGTGTETDTKGDIPGITKFVLGWIDNPHLVTGTGTVDISLSSFSTDSELVIIPPNGDLTNNRWLVVEYVTPEGNNINSGVRIWKTVMNLGEGYNVIGSSPTKGGSISSPYQYIEALHPDDVTNFYYQAGESLTPYTYPSTSWGQSWVNVNGSRYLTDLAWSGISVSVRSMDGDTASLQITIDDAPDTQTVVGTYHFTLSSDSPSFLSSSVGVKFAELTADCEITAVSEIQLYDTVDHTSIPLYAEADGKTISLYIRQEEAENVRLNRTYTLALSQNIKTYYGAAVSPEGGNPGVVFDFFPYAMAVSEKYKNGVVQYDPFSIPTYFRLSENEVSYIHYHRSGSRLELGKINTDTNEAILIPLDSSYVTETGLNSVNTWMIDGKYYAVLFQINGTKSYIEIFDLDGNQLNGMNTGALVDFCGGKSSMVKTRNGTDFYQIAVTDDHQIKYYYDELLSDCIAENSTAMRYVTSVEKVGEGKYCVLCSSGQKVVLINGDQVITTKADFGSYLNLGNAVYYEGKFYIVTAADDMMLYIYNGTTGALEKEILLLEGISSEDIKSNSLTDLSVVKTDTSLFISFVASGSTKKASSYLLLFDENYKVSHYYRYGDGTANCRGMILHLQHDLFFIGKENFYYTFTAESHPVEGDTNGDGLVNLADAAYLNLHFAVPEDYPLTDISHDYDGDGTTEAEDAAALAWTLIRAAS